MSLRQSPIRASIMMHCCIYVACLHFTFYAFKLQIFMVALCNRADHSILPLFLSIFFFFFSPNLSGRRLDVLPYFHTWCGLSANFECMSERCCMRLAANEGSKKVAKNRHLGTIPQLCRPISSELRHVSTIGKKLVKQQYLLYMSSQYGEHDSDRFVSLGHPCKFQLKIISL